MDDRNWVLRPQNTCNLGVEKTSSSSSSSIPYQNNTTRQKLEDSSRMRLVTPNHTSLHRTGDIFLLLCLSCSFLGTFLSPFRRAPEHSLVTQVLEHTTRILIFVEGQEFGTLRNLCVHVQDLLATIHTGHLLPENNYPLESSILSLHRLAS